MMSPLQIVAGDDALPVDPGEGYRLHRYSSQYKATPVERPQDLRYNVNGDTLHVYEMIGPDKLAIATSMRGRRYPFLPIMEGSEITRPFDSFTIRLLSSRLPLGNDATIYPITEALIISSFGRVYTRPEKEIGLVAGFGSAQGLATPTGVDMLRAAFETNATTNPWLFSDSQRPTYFKYGGTLRVKNLDTVPIYLYYGKTGNFSTGVGGATIFTPKSAWTIAPGVTEEFRVESLATQRFHLSRVGSSINGTTICIACDAGTALYQVMVSKLILDGTDSESGNLASQFLRADLT